MSIELTSDHPAVSLITVLHRCEDCVVWSVDLHPKHVDLITYGADIEADEEGPDRDRLFFALGKGEYTLEWEDGYEEFIYLRSTPLPKGWWQIIVEPPARYTFNVCIVRMPKYDG